MATIPPTPPGPTLLRDLITAAIKGASDEVNAFHAFCKGDISMADHATALRVRRDAIEAALKAAEKVDYPALAELDRRAAS